MSAAVINKVADEVISNLAQEIWQEVWEQFEPNNGMVYCRECGSDISRDQYKGKWHDINHKRTCVLGTAQTILFNK